MHYISYTMADIYFISQKTIGVRMSETATVSFRTDPKVKEEAKALYESMGMDFTSSESLMKDLMDA